MDLQTKCFDQLSAFSEPWVCNWDSSFCSCKNFQQCLISASKWATLHSNITMAILRHSFNHKNPFWKCKVSSFLFLCCWIQSRCTSFPACQEKYRESNNIFPNEILPYAPFNFKTGSFGSKRTKSPNKFTILFILLTLSSFQVLIGSPCCFFSLCYHLFSLRYRSHRLPQLEVGSRREGSTSFDPLHLIAHFWSTEQKNPKRWWGCQNIRSHLCLLRYVMSQPCVLFSNKIMYWKAKTGTLGFPEASQVKISMLFSALVFHAV